MEPPPKKERMSDGILAVTGYIYIYMRKARSVVQCSSFLMHVRRVNSANVMS